RQPPKWRERKSLPACSGPARAHWRRGLAGPTKKAPTASGSPACLLLPGKVAGQARLNTALALHDRSALSRLLRFLRLTGGLREASLLDRYLVGVEQFFSGPCQVSRGLVRLEVLHRLGLFFQLLEDLANFHLRLPVEDLALELLALVFIDLGPVR